MNILKKALLSLACAAALGSSMTASAVEIKDSISYNPNQLVATFDSFTYTHDIRDNGYKVGSDRLLSAILTVRLTDIVDFPFLNDFFAIKIGANPVVTGTGVPDFTFGSATGGKVVSFALNPLSLLDLAQDGRIDVTVSTSRPLSSVFFLASSTLTAQVPEPLSIALLGIGLLGIGAARRQSAKKNQA